MKTKTKINRNALARRVCEEIRAHVGKDKVDVSIAQVKLVMASTLRWLACYDGSQVLALLEKIADE